MNDYEKRRQDRIDRLHEKAEKARDQSSDLYQKAMDMLHVIPLGQPIHGPADRRYRAKIDKKMDQAIAASDKAAYYERRAQAAENNTAISSDDPEAIAKLTEKLELLKTAQELMKAVNAFYRKHGTCHGMEGLSEELAEELDQEVKNGPSWVNVPFESYALSNNNQNINSTKKRIQKLTEARELGYTGWTFEGGRVEVNMEKNRLQIFFDEIPSEDVRKELKGRSFKWARSEGAWQRQLTDNAIYAASRIKAIQPIDGIDPVKIQPKHKKQSGPTR